MGQKGVTYPATSKFRMKYGIPLRPGLKNQVFIYPCVLCAGCYSRPEKNHPTKIMRIGGPWDKITWYAHLINFYGMPVYCNCLLIARYKQANSFLGLDNPAIEGKTCQIVE